MERERERERESQADSPRNSEPSCGVGGRGCSIAWRCDHDPSRNQELDTQGPQLILFHICNIQRPILGDF